MTAIPAPTEGLTRTERLVPPATPTIGELCDHAGAMVSHASALAGEVAHLHTRSVSTSAEAERIRLDHQAQMLSGRPLSDLLDRLAEGGRGHLVDSV